jgi:hypothetical protein
VLNELPCGTTYFPRVTTYDGKAIEQALAGPSLVDPGVRLEGAVVEATFASREPPLVGRLRSASVPYLIDPQTLRFSNGAFLAVDQLMKLPYAPSTALTPEAMGRDGQKRFTAEGLGFQQTHSAANYLAPAVPLFDGRNWNDLNLALLERAVEINGVEVDHRPLVAMLAPGRRALGNVREAVEPLADLPIVAAYVQPLRLHPTRDGVEKLAQYWSFLAAVQEVGISVIAGRVGPFGLVLQALGLEAFDSGLGEAENFDLAQLNRTARRPRDSSRRGGGRSRRVYLEGLKTTMLYRHVQPLLAEGNPLRPQLVCSLPCCRWKGFEDLSGRRRQHYLYVRATEVEQVRQLPTSNARLQAVHQQLLAARSHASTAARVLRSAQIDVPSFEHVDRWLGLISRVAGIDVAA